MLISKKVEEITLSKTNITNKKPMIKMEDIINPKNIRIAVLLVLSALIQAFALHNFFEKSGLLSGGLTGFGLIITAVLKQPELLGTILLVLNIPLAMLGFFNIGKIFTILSFVNVFLTSVFLSIVPQVLDFDDLMLNAIFGGVLLGVAIGLALEAGASTGGTDFIAMFISVKLGASAGTLMLIINGIIVVLGGILFGWEIAAFTMISVYATSRVVDTIHVRYQRMTLAIITSKGDEIRKALLETGNHGITTMKAEGAYHKKSKEFIYTVVSTFEINDVRDKIFEIDPNAFVNVTKSVKLFGNFNVQKYK